MGSSDAKDKRAVRRATIARTCARPCFDISNSTIPSSFSPYYACLFITVNTEWRKSLKLSVFQQGIKQLVSGNVTASSLMVKL